MLLNALASLGHKGIKTLRTFGRAGLMLFLSLIHISEPTRPY